MSVFDRLRAEWFGNIRGDILSGTVVALALIPEAIAFSLIAGVDPKVGLYASFSICVVIAFAGGRPGMISAATGAMALLMVDLVKDHGLDYLLAASVLAGVFQVLAGLFRLGEYIRFVSRSVMTGFVNALAILIFLAQMPELIGRSWETYAMVAAGLGIIYLLPLVTKAVPSALVAIIVLSVVAVTTGADLRSVGDMGALPDAFPPFFIPQVPLSLDTLWIILPYSLTLAAVGLLESLMTASIVDEFTDTRSDKNRECAGQGLANMVTGFFGGMAGCAMIGQSVINVKSGGRGRLSTLWAGGFLLFLILVLADLVRQIPMAALVAVMIMVSIGTFRWSSLKELVLHPKSSSAVMVATVAVVVVTHDLAKGVLVGVLMSAVFFARKVSHMVEVNGIASDGGRRLTYVVEGQIFFASAELFVQSFDFHTEADSVVIVLNAAHLWDITGIAALDRVVLKYRALGKQVELIGLNEASTTLVERHAIHHKDAAEVPVPGH